LDSGDPAETVHAVELLGNLDGQTTNPSLIAKSPEIEELLKTKKFTRTELFDKYHDIAMRIREILPTGDISAEVYADENSTADELLDQAYKIAEWFPGIFVKLPITKAGLAAAQQLVSDDISVNMTLCFSQEQAAAVHATTKHATNAKVYVSPFIGRLDDINQNGSDLIKNIQSMYKDWNSHVGVLGASIRSVDHIKLCIDEEIAAMTIPFKLIKEVCEVASSQLSLESEKILPPLSPSIPRDSSPQAGEQKIQLAPIEFKKLEELPWSEYNIDHELTKKGLEKFAADWNALCE
jgi:transaldolase